MSSSSLAIKVTRGTVGVNVRTREDPGRSGPGPVAVCRLLADRRGCGGEDREVAVLLAGSRRVVGIADVGDVDGVQPAGAVAQFVTGELAPDIGEVDAVIAGRGLQDAVQDVDALVERLVVPAAQAYADRDG